MKTTSNEHLLSKIDELETRLAEAEQLIEAIKAGEVDAFALNRGDQAEIYTLQSGDYAYRILVENFGEGALNLTEDGLIVYTNKYFHELLNLTYEDVIGTSVFTFIHDESKEKFQQIFENGLAGKSKGEINLVAADKLIPVYVSLTSLHPTLSTVGMIVSDLSEKKQYEQQLEDKNIELGKSNTELASFSYIASHDLQEPLRKIQTFSARILEKDNTNLSETGKMMFGRMQLAAKRMQTLIDDLLAYSRTNTEERKFEKVYLGKIVEEVKEDLREELKEKNATVKTNVMCEASILPFQFRQLIYNLLSNSLKFSKPGQAPHIKIESEIIKGSLLNDVDLAPEKLYCHISVSDDGIGFEMQYHQKIFELFQRLHGKDEYPGTGIGLSIVKRIVENHKGIIEAHSELNNGATFDIYLPAE
ncbi:MAG: ATP-binding protein [Parafilimonas sp.]